MNSSNLEQASQKLESALNNLGINIDRQNFDKIIFICGDLGKKKFGMDDTEYGKLADSIGIIIIFLNIILHCW